MSAATNDSEAEVNPERYFDGQVYHTNRPPSEQPVVLTVTKKFRGKPSAADVDITEDELRHFVTVYPRLYIVPATTRGRLTEWRDANQQIIGGWSIHEFWNPKAQDRLLNLIFKKGAIPPEAKKTRAEDDAASQKRAAASLEADNSAIPKPQIERIIVRNSAPEFDDEESSQLLTARGRAASDMAPINELRGLLSEIEDWSRATQALAKRTEEKATALVEKYEKRLMSEQTSLGGTRTRGHPAADHITEEEEGRWERRQMGMPAASRFDHPDHQLGFPAQRGPRESARNPNGPLRDILGSIEDDDTRYRHYQSEVANSNAAHLRLHRGFSRRPPSSMPGESAFSSRVDIDETRRGRISPSNSRHHDDLLGPRNLRNDLAGSQSFSQVTQSTHEFDDYPTSTRASSRARMGNNPLYGAVDGFEAGNYQVHPAYEGRAPYGPLNPAPYISQPHHAQRRPLPDRIISPGVDPESAHRPSRSRFRTGSASNNSDKPRPNSDNDRDSCHFPRRHASRRPPSAHSDDETASGNQQPLTAPNANTNTNPSAPSLTRKTKQRATVPAGNKKRTATTTTAAITTATPPAQPTHLTKTTATKTAAATTTAAKTKPKPKTKKTNHDNPRASTTQPPNEPPNKPNPTPPTPPKVEPSADTGCIPDGVDFNPLSDTPLAGSGLQQQQQRSGGGSGSAAPSQIQTQTEQREACRGRAWTRGLARLRALGGGGDEGGDDGDEGEPGGI